MYDILQLVWSDSDENMCIRVNTVNTTIRHNPLLINAYYTFLDDLFYCLIFRFQYSATLFRALGGGNVR